MTLRCMGGVGGGVEAIITALNIEKWDKAKREAAEKFLGFLLASDRNATPTSLSRKKGLLAEFSESS